MYIGIIAVWFFCIASFMPRLAGLWHILDSGLMQALLIFVLLCLALFWFYGIRPLADAPLTTMIIVTFYFVIKVEKEKK